MQRTTRQKTILLFITSYLIVTIGCKKHSDSGVAPSDQIPGVASTLSLGSLYFQPSGIAIDTTSGNIYVSDNYSHRIFKITSAGIVDGFAGSGIRGSDNGTGEEASFNRPSGIAVDDSGNVYVADTGNNLIRKITPGGVVTTVAGSVSGFKNGMSTDAKFDSPSGVAVDATGNVYVADLNNQRIRKISTDGLVTTFAGTGYTQSNDGKDTLASFNQPSGITVDALGNLYIADAGNNLIRKITFDGVVTTLTGNGHRGLINGNQSTAEFYYPTGVVVDKRGNVYVADYSNNCIRKTTPDGLTTTYAGSGNAGHSDGSGSNASFQAPKAIALDTLGSMYVADFGNFLIRKVVVEKQNDSMIVKTK